MGGLQYSSHRPGYRRTAVSTSVSLLPLRATQPVSSGKGKPGAALLAQPALRPGRPDGLPREPNVQVWTLTLTGCVRQDLGSHRVGDSLEHHL